MISTGSGKFRVCLKESKNGEDIVLLLSGGEKPHIGSVVMCEPGKRTRTMTLKNHLDWIVAKPIAEKVCRERKRTVVCVAGIHVNNATKDDINTLKDNCRELESML